MFFVAFYVLHQNCWRCLVFQKQWDLLLSPPPQLLVKGQVKMVLPWVNVTPHWCITPFSLVPSPPQISPPWHVTPSMTSHLPIDGTPHSALTVTPSNLSPPWLGKCPWQCTEMKYLGLSGFVFVWEQNKMFKYRTPSSLTEEVTASWTFSVSPYPSAERGMCFQCEKKTGPRKSREGQTRGFEMDIFR